MVGQRIGHLTVIADSERKNKKQQEYWVCRCDCGRYLIVRGDMLRCGRATHCSECGTGQGKRSVFVNGVDENGVV